jgi:hypothetical protein
MASVLAHELVEATSDPEVRREGLLLGMCSHRLAKPAKMHAYSFPDQFLESALSTPCELALVKLRQALAL